MSRIKIIIFISTLVILISLIGIFYLQTKATQVAPQTSSANTHVTGDLGAGSRIKIKNPLE